MIRPGDLGSEEIAAVVAWLESKGIAPDATYGIRQLGPVMVVYRYQLPIRSDRRRRLPRLIWVGWEGSRASGPRFWSDS